MLADGHISPAQAQAALEQPMEVRLHRPAKVKAPYYTETVRQWLEERFGTTMLYEGGLTVYTACDPRLTAYGQEAIRRGLEELNRRHGFRGPVARVSAEQLRAIRRRPVSRGSFRPGQETEAVVTAPDGEGGWWLRLGSARGRLTPQALEWVRRGGGPVLKPGDVIRVRLVAYHAPSRAWRLEVVQPPAAQAALLCLEAHTGKVRVLIGGRDFAQSQYNRAIQAHRQPGSAFKPFIYAAALDHPVLGFTPSSIIVDAPVVFDDPAHPGQKWKPKNYENRFFGPTTLRNALAHSRNVVTVKLLAQLGIRYTMDYARKFGFTSPLAPNLSLALGSSGLSLLELTRAYSVFANGGKLVEPVMVEKVLDRRGKVIYQARPQVRQVISPQTAFIMTHLLRGVVEHGTGRKMKALGRPVAGKTGTTNDLRDAWFIGFTPRLVCGVWVGRDDNRPLGRRETGARAAGPIWLYFMQQALQGTPPQDFPVPPGVVFAKVDLDTGRPLPPGAEGGFFEAFRQGHEPTPPQPGQPAASTEGASGFLQAETFAPGQKPSTPPSEQP
jgi:penicillin-binding protein 1A